MKIQKLLAIIGIVVAACAAVAGVILLIRHFSGKFKCITKQYVCDCPDDPEESSVTELNEMEPLEDIADD